MPKDDPHLPDSDAELVRRIRRGDDAAFNRLVDRHGRRLLGLAVAMLGNLPDAEDVVQESLAAAFQGLGGFRGQASVKTWLTRILLRRIARLRRYRRIRRMLSLDRPADAAADASALAPPAPPDAASADLRMDVTTVLAELSAEHRDVIVLREMQQLTYDQIAAVLAVPRGTVESRLHRARRHLKELLKDYLP